jgi:CRP-like cAMP-binding protein
MHDVSVYLDGQSKLPVKSIEAGEVILRKGQTTGRLFVLKQGAVEVVSDGQQIAVASEPGAVFGELGVLLDQPHMADVRVLEPSTFYIADGKVFLRVHREAALHVAMILARRLSAAHRNLDGVKSRLPRDQRDGELGDMIDAVDRSLQLAPPR